MVLVGTGSRWYCVSIVRHWLVLGGTGSQHGAVVIGTWWYRVSIGRCRMVLDGAGSVWSGIVYCEWYWAHMPLYSIRPLYLYMTHQLVVNWLGATDP